MSLLIKNIKALAGLHAKDKFLLKGSELNNLPSIENAFLLTEGDKIKSFGKMEEISSLNISVGTKEIDAKGKFVLPAFCDSHTHLVFAATRESEFVDKISGLTYEQIAAKGGGILNSAKKLAVTSEEELVESALIRLQEVQSQGTGAVEIKSGYGLSVEAELKMLRVIRKLKTLSPLTIKSTFLGAHAVPVEYKNNRNEYIRIIIEEMLPRIADEGLADYCDVFCENGFYTPDETDKILQAGWKYNLKPKIHANQLAISGGVQAGVRNNAISVDHLENIGDEEITVLKNSSTIATMLPSAAFFLRLPYPPARKMIEENLTVTLATDFNPGSSPSGRMSFVISLACIQMRMTPEEAINAATINGAAAMELSNSFGSIAIGKKANLIITKEISSLANIPYFFGRDCIDQVIVNGE
ncbi:MAG: imidazolonepropionase [Sphingobacteriales bacterium]|nr:MAG: imidazolonepropionase [Sphingobacteriales bacterium]